MGAFETSARRAAVKVVQTLRGAGHVAYFAGGCVRDALLGHPPKDYDVATDAHPDAVRKLFRRSQFVGEAFGVVLVKVRGDAPPPGRRRPITHRIEVATFRTEWGYADGRRPDGVAFSDAQHDAQRRDFTVNGLFEDPLAADESRRIIDYVGGVADLRRRVIRAIGDPNERFGEDFLRMLRAVRFAARLDFMLDAATAAAIRAHAPMLTGISRERIGQEVRQMLTGPRPARCMALMQRLELDAPALDEPHAAAPLFTCRAMMRIRRSEQVEFPTALCAWVLDRALRPGPGAPDACARLAPFVNSAAAPIIARWRKALCLTNDDRDAMRRTLTLLARAAAWPALGAAPRKRLLAEPHWPAARQLLRAMRFDTATAALLDRLEADAAPLISEGVAPPRLVSGDDLVTLGVPPGPRFGQLLEDIYDRQLEGKLATRDEAIDYARGLNR